MKVWAETGSGHVEEIGVLGGRYDPRGGSLAIGAGERHIAAAWSEEMPSPVPFEAWALRGAK